MSTTKQLKIAAEELIEILGLIDDVTKEEIVLSKKVTDDELIALIKEAADEITPEDDLSDETREIIAELLTPAKKKATPAPVKEKTKKAPVVEDEDEDVELDEIELEDEDEDEDVELDNDIEDDDIEVVIDTKKIKKPTTPTPVKEKKAPAEKAPKAPKAPKVKVEKEKLIGRQITVFEAIKTMCKKGATLKEIMVASNNEYVKAGGESNPTATNVNSYSINALVEFGVLVKSDDGVFTFKK